MAKNERIIAQDLAELKHAMQNQDIARITESYEILLRDISCNARTLCKIGTCV